MRAYESFEVLLQGPFLPIYLTETIFAIVSHPLPDSDKAWVFWPCSHPSVTAANHTMC